MKNQNYFIIKKLKTQNQKIQRTFDQFHQEFLKSQ